MNGQNNVCAVLEPIEARLESEQALSLKEVAAGQLHRLEAFGPDSEKFVLVMDARRNYCDVIPGSLDGFQAGPYDVVLPKSVMGGAVMLGLNHPVRMRSDTLGEGFARLTPKAFRRIVRAFVDNSRGKDEIGLIRGYPYTSENDERLAYRREMMEQTDSCALPEIVLSPVRLWEDVELALAAGEEKTADVRRAECRVQGFDGRVLIVHNRESNELSLDVYDAGGNVSEALDGWILVDADGNELAEIHGSCVRPVSVGAFNGSCCLMDTEFQAHTMSLVRE